MQTSAHFTWTGFHLKSRSENEPVAKSFRDPCTHNKIRLDLSGLSASPCEESDNSLLIFSTPNRLKIIKSGRRGTGQFPQVDNFENAKKTDRRK